MYGWVERVKPNRYLIIPYIPRVYPCPSVVNTFIYLCSSAVHCRIWVSHFQNSSNPSCLPLLPLHKYHSLSDMHLFKIANPIFHRRHTCLLSIARVFILSTFWPYSIRFSNHSSSPSSAADSTIPLLGGVRGGSLSPFAGSIVHD